MERSTRQSILIHKNKGIINGVRIPAWIVMLLLCITGSFLGCKKNCLEKQPCDRLTAVLHKSGEYFHLFFNSNGKLSRLTSGNKLTTYEYNATATIVTSLDSGRFVSKTIVSLNALGLAVNVRREENVAGTDWSNTVYEYIGEKLARSTITSSAGGAPSISTYTWTNQDLTSIFSGNTVNRLDYYLDRPDQPADYLGLLQLFQGYRLYSNKHLLKTISGGSISYQFRPDGAITSSAVTSANNLEVFNYTVIYECN